MTTRDLSALSLSDSQHHLHPMTSPVSLRANGPDMVIQAQGVYLYTDCGRQVLDMGSGFANVCLGYGNQRLCEKAFAAMRELSYSHSWYGRTNPWAAALSAKLAQITPEQYKTFLFASSGSEAVESAVKIALRYWRLRSMPEKRAFISRRRSYHGSTMFAASLSGYDMFHLPFGLPMSGSIYHAESTCWFQEAEGRSREQYGADLIRELERQINEIGPRNIAAFIGDPFPDNVHPPRNYWEEIRRLCDNFEILLIVDEVVSGFGKTGKMFGFQQFNFQPDMIVMAKGITSGYFPLSSVAVGETVARLLQSTDESLAHGFTNSGHPVGAAVALENIAVIESCGLVERVNNEIGPHFSRKLTELLDCPAVGNVESIGVLGRIDIDISRQRGADGAVENESFMEKVIDIAWSKGVAMKGVGFCLPLTITSDQIDEGISVVKASLLEAHSTLR